MCTRKQEDIGLAILVESLLQFFFTFLLLYHTMHEGRSLVPRPAQSSVARITGTKNGVLRATRKLRGTVNEAMRL